jgi:hypothetical protein
MNIVISDAMASLESYMTDFEDKVNKLLKDIEMKEDIYKVYKQAKFGRLSSESLSVLSKYDDYSHLVNRYPDITDKNRSAVSVIVSTSLESTVVAAAGAVAKTGLGAVAKRTFGWMMNIMMIVSFISMLSGGIFGLVNYLAKNTRYLQKFVNKLNEYKQNNMLDREVIEIIPITSALSKVVYTYRNHDESCIALKQLLDMITHLENTKFILDENKFNSIVKKLNYEKNDKSIYEKKDKDTFCRISTILRNNGWSLDNILKGLEFALNTARSYKVLNDTYKSLEQLRDKLKNDKAATDGDKDIKHDSSNIDAKQNMTNVKQLIMLYSMESRKLMLSSVALAKAILKTI